MAMTASKEVKVTEECKITPAPNPPEKKLSSSSDEGNNNYLPLTFFDTIWLKFPPTQRLFFYEINHLSSHLFYNTILPNLKHSLSLTLQHYPSLAGNLNWHPETAKPIIRYSIADDGGVPFSVAESCTLDFDSLSTDHFKEAKDLHHLLPDFHYSESKANVLSLRVTLFPNYGFSIGYCAHHTSMDGKSTSMFLSSWATICRRLGEGGAQLTPELIPILDRSFIQDPSNISTIFTNQWMKMIHGNENKRSFVPLDMKPAPGLFRSTFRLTPEQIGHIKEKLAIIKSPVSTFTAVCSYVWTCLVKAEEGDITKEIVYLNINVDCRGESRWDPPVPANYFGNCVTYRFAKAKVECLKGGDGLVVAAAAIKEEIGSLAVKGKVENWLLEVSSTFRNEKVYGIGGSPWFDFYGVDFGWGRPEKVEMVSSDRNGSFSLCDCRDGNGVIEIGIVLSKPKIQAFASIFAQGLLQEIAS
ncbi:phenolic glucoside malonyltransferase 1-like [Impatiens glandulifera]|uniref:phenolic glucoside malonyltransferase 1-like n=1 Tax=Impatiens glandulifera TaxID=253017 RepID=UPI001FB08597|nr:phenolic glucoside malonyltransferase 1-like [Impatiens glandulifera]